jgi:hypothetical protein
LIFKESTNRAAALLRASGISRSAKLVPLSPIGTADFLFDPVALGGCVNRPGRDGVEWGKRLKS